MSRGDAYIYAIILRNKNVEKIYKLTNQYIALSEIIYEWLDGGEYSPIPLAIHIAEQLRNEIKDELTPLTRDNLDMILLCTDLNSDDYYAIENYMFIYVDEFLKRHSKEIFKDAQEYLEKHLGRYIWFSHVHHDDFEEWRSEFKMRSRRR